jgi:YD repeat-containing protein
MHILPDNTRWHFDAQGDLVGIESGPFLTVYRREVAQNKPVKIEGWYKDRKEAFIDLSYSGTGKLAEAKGSNGFKVKYNYGQNNFLSKIELPDGTLTYQYHNSKLTEIHWNNTLVQRFQYNELGQLLSETKTDKTPLTYMTEATGDGYRFSAASENGSLITEYDPAYRPLSLRFGNRTLAKWHYGADSSVTCEIGIAPQEKYVFRSSAGGRKRSLQLPEGGLYESERDEERRVTKLKVNGEVAVEQGRNNDGTLNYTKRGHTIQQYQYNEYGEPVRVITGRQGSDENFTEWTEEMYNEEGLPVQVRDFSGRDIRFSYDNAGELSAVSVNGNTVRLVREDAADKLTTSWGAFHTMYYTKEGTLDKIETGGSGARETLKFRGGRIDEVVQWDKGRWNFNYYDNSQNRMLKQINAPNGLSFLYNYDKEKQLASVEIGNHCRAIYERDKKGRLAAIKLTAAQLYL